jgi:hypothetical protein
MKRPVYIYIYIYIYIYMQDFRHTRSGAAGRNVLGLYVVSSIT